MGWADVHIHLLPMSMVTARQWWTCFSAFRRFAGGKLTSLVQCSVFSLSLDVRTGSCSLFSWSISLRSVLRWEVQMLPHIHKIISSNLPPSTLLPHYDTLSRPHRAEQRPHRDQNAGQGGFPGESENAKADFCCVRGLTVDCLGHQQAHGTHGHTGHTQRRHHDPAHHVNAKPT